MSIGTAMELRRAALGLALGPLALLLPPSCAPPAPAEGTALEAARPEEGGTFRMVQDLRPASLDPADSSSIYSALAVNQLFDGLLAIDPGMSLRPALAETWSVSADGRTLSFVLRHDVLFHDGRPLEADDVVFTLRRLLSPARARRSIAAPYLLAIDGAEDYAAGRRADLPGIDAPRPDLVRIHLARRSPFLLEALTLDSARVVPRHRLEDGCEAEFARAPVGTGPFRLLAWEEGALHLVRNDDYFGGPPHLDQVRIEFPRGYERERTARRFLAGELDVVRPGAGDLDRLAGAPFARLVRFPGLNLHYLGISTVLPPLDDVRVRQAIAHAVDREALVAPFREVRRAATGIFPPGMAGYTPEPKTLAHDPARARALLAEAGHPGGEGLAPLVLYLVGRDEPALHLVDRVCADLAEVGLSLETRTVGWDDLGRVLEARAAPLFLLGWVADLSDEDPFIRSLFAPGGSANNSAFEDAEVTEELERAAAEPSPIERTRLLRRAERRILALAPIVPLHHATGLLVARSEVRGMRFGPLGLESVDLEKVWLARASGKR